jgi:aminopeptidase 2
MIGQAHLCLDVTARAMPVYEQVSDAEYPLPKLDKLSARDFNHAAIARVGD